MRRLLDRTDGYDTFLHDALGEYAFEVEQDVTAVVESNKALYNVGNVGTKTMTRVATIPMGVIYGWIQKYGVDPTKKGQEDLLKRLLNDPEYLYLRTSPGKI